MAIQNPILAKSSCSRQNFTQFSQEASTFSQGNDLSDVNDANHNQIKQDDQSSYMNMLRDILGYAFNKQSQMYLENNACNINKNKIWIFNISHKNLSS